MKIVLVLILGLIVFTNSHAKEDDGETEIDRPNLEGISSQPSVGFGAQFGGIIGGEVGFFYKRAKLRGAFGFFGYALGADFAITDKVTIGAQYFVAFGPVGYGASLNYHFDSVYSSGWFFGLDVVMYDTVLFEDSPVIDYRQGAFISVGYRLTPY